MRPFPAAPSAAFLRMSTSSLHFGHVYTNPPSLILMLGEQLAHIPVPQYGQKMIFVFFELQVGQPMPFSAWILTKSMEDLGIIGADSLAADPREGVAAANCVPCCDKPASWLMTLEPPLPASSFFSWGLSPRRSSKVISDFGACFEEEPFGGVTFKFLAMPSVLVLFSWV